MSFENFPPEFLQRMQEMMQSGQLQLPPPIFNEMGGEFVSLDLDEKTMVVRFPVQERYQNPMGYMQGGMIAAAIDNAIGPLSFMVAPPNVTKTLTITYQRPIPPSMASITVEARLEKQDGRSLTFTATVRRDEKTVLATAVAEHRTMREK